MGEGSGDPAVVMAIFAALTYDIISATNSSPQTTEINAKKRGATLMKWVQLGLGQTALFVLIGVAVQARAGRPVWPPILGAGLAGGMLWAQYQHALKSGLASAEPGTETY
jgi:4-hydroxybenzoate polyprenyltransferase